MPVELRKRKEAPSAPIRATKKKAPAKREKAAENKTIVEKVQEAAADGAEIVKGAVTDKSVASTSSKVGSIVDLTTFGGEVETHDGQKTTLSKLVEESKGGVVLFTYPKASTPGCTTQVCLFRDAYAPLTSTGYSIFGLSSDSLKSNTTFKTKQNLPYTLLCDPAQTLIAAIGMKKSPKGTTRGVFVIDKSGKVLAAEPGGPAATVEVVRKLIQGGGTSASPAPDSKKKEDKEVAETAAEVADAAVKVDSDTA